MRELKDLFTPRDLPLLFVVLPQAYVVGLWQWESSGYSTSEAWGVAAWVALFFAILGGIGYEAIYVGSLAWARKLHNARGAHGWAFATALLALVFSVGVAVYQYRAQGTAAWLHAGLPIVGFFYTVMTFAAHKADASHAPTPTPVLSYAREAEPLPAPVAHGARDPYAVYAQLRADGASSRAAATQAGISESTARQRWNKANP